MLMATGQDTFKVLKEIMQKKIFLVYIRFMKAKLFLIIKYIPTWLKKKRKKII